MRRILMTLAFIAAALLLAPPTGAVTPATAPTAAVKAAAEKVDLNAAGVDELTAVPGIGPATAKSILELRQRKGRFSSLDDLLEVRGIKEKRLKQLSKYLVVPTAAAPARTKPGP
jgi:competence protein ComEA